MSLLEIFVLLSLPAFTILAFFIRSKFFLKKDKVFVKKFDLTVVIALILLAALSQWLMGRQVFGNANFSHLISLDVNSQYNSQTLFDAYTFSHVIHGFLFFYFFRWLLKKRSIGTWAILAIMVETFWEVSENTNMVINHYRTATISLNYVGDSILNSVCDTLFCLLGFYIATKLAPKYVIALIVLMEIGCLLWIRDNLTLNILMLLYPIQAIKTWQSGL